MLPLVSPREASRWIASASAEQLDRLDEITAEVANELAHGEPPTEAITALAKCVAVARLTSGSIPQLWKTHVADC